MAYPNQQSKTVGFLVLTLIFFKPVHGIAQRNQFDHRNIFFSTAAPVPKGTIHFYNYYLLFNELEVAVSDRFSVAVGGYPFPNFSELLLTARVRYAVPISERLHWAIHAQSFGYYYFDFDLDSDARQVLISTMTYTSPKFTGTLSSGLGYATIERNSGVFVGGSFRYTPGAKGIFSLMVDGGIGQGTVFSLNNRLTYPGLLTAGFQFALRRMAFQTFAVGLVENQYVEIIPGISARLRF